ncbi:MAG: tRNA (5-methylaminomethyl-2-thiouridine)(34)-methyltransferase MnmD [Asticcacaulis sp.]
MSSNDPQLYFAEDGAPRSARFDDIYYSLQDGLSESRAVFLNGCHMPQVWGGRSDFTVLELGFGTGLNIAALMQLWSQTRPSGAHLHIVSVEGYLMSREAAAQALANWPELAPFSEALLAQWPKARTGFHYMDFPAWGISLMIGLMDVRLALSAWAGKADAIFLDGFSPALNRDMWAEDVLALIAQKSKPGARLATFTVAGFVRRGLQAAGFDVEKCPGFGRKKERLEAILAGELTDGATRPHKMAIIGAGIAGCALVHQARLMGLEADLFDAEGTGTGASGNMAALVTPRFDAGDNEISALFADAFAHASGLYQRECPHAILGTGVHHLEATPRDASRHARIAAQAGFAPGDMALFKAGALPEMPEACGLTLNTGLWIRPTDVLACLLADQQPIIEKIVDFQQNEGGSYTLLSVSGARFDGYDAVILTCGEGLFDLKTYAQSYELRPVRGQVEWVADTQPLRAALSWGGYAIPMDGGFLFGATHERDDRSTDVTQADRTRNLQSLALAMPERAERIKNGPFRSRVGIRVMTRDFLPMCGEIGNGLYMLSGLAARGFCLAPLLAKDLLATVTGAPSALPLTIRPRLQPRHSMRTD